jgi:hypothetical protein
MLPMVTYQVLVEIEEEGMEETHPDVTSESGLMPET